MSPGKHPVLALPIPLLLLGLAPGCAAAAPPPETPRHLQEVRTMSVGVRSESGTICPRERVQMSVVADIVIAGEAEPMRVDTWRDGDADKTHNLDFSNFAFESDHGTFDGEGWFYPSPSVLATASAELEIRTLFIPGARSVVTRYKPDYSCIRTVGLTGAAGLRGRAGVMGRVGGTGSWHGSQGGAGAPGGAGGDGAAGPSLVVYATRVKTRFYERLVALALREDDGDVVDLVLVHEGQRVVARASGGPGGEGGGGGTGGAGGVGGPGLGSAGASGGPGGPGGRGGKGGDGGHGGTISFVYDARFPELSDAVVLDARGGEPGQGGEGGASGAGGRGGMGAGFRYVARARTLNSNGGEGGSGGRGPRGASGRTGEDGQTSAAPGEVAKQFANLPGVTLL